MTDRVESGVAQGFDAFFRDEFPRLLALGRALAPSVAGDVAQEALLRAFGRWTEVAALDAPGAWVRRVMLNLITDHHRAGRRYRHMQDRLAVQSTESVHGADETAIELIDEEWFTAVRGLPRREREVVALHYIDQLPVAEVAEVLGIAPGTVKKSLHRARRKLTERFDEGST